MKRGHIRVAKGFPKGPQETALEKAGVTNLYYDDVNAAIRSVRKGDVLYVVGMAGLAGSKDGINAATTALHAKGAAAVDVATGRRSDGAHGLALGLEATKALANGTLGGAKFAKVFGKKGGEAKAKNRIGQRTPTDKARTIWFDLSIGTNAEALARINDYGYSIDWGLRAAQTQFGPSKRRKGRRSTD